MRLRFVVFIVLVVRGETSDEGVGKTAVNNKGHIVIVRCMLGVFVANFNTNYT